MKKYFCLLILMLAFTAAKAQLPLNAKYYADSIMQELQHPLPDKTKAKLSFLLAEYFREADSVKAQQYLQQGFQYSKGSQYMQAVYLFFAAQQMTGSNTDSAAKLYLEAESRMKYFQNKEALRARSRCWHDYARLIHVSKDDPETYVDILLNRAIPLAQQAGDSAYVGKNYLDVAIGFKNLNNYGKADEYLQRAIATLKKAPDASHYLAAAYHTASENYSLSGKAEEAGALLDSMRVLLLPYPESESWLDYYAGEGMRLTIAFQFDKSLAIINKGIELSKKLQKNYPEQRLMLQKFYALYNKKDLTAARDVALELTHRYPFMNIATNRAQVFYGLSATYEELKNMPKAYEWLKKYASVNDSLYRKKLETEVNSLEIKFRTAEKQKKIAELEVDRQKASLKEKSQRQTNWLLGFATTFLLVMTAFLIFYYQNSRKLVRQKEINHRQQLKEIQQQQQLKLTEAVLEGEERERQRIARDLHDGLGGMLAGVKIKLSGQPRSGSEDKLDGVIQQLDDSVTELRRIARNMMPESLLKVGLEAALQDLCDALLNDHTRLEFQAYGIKKDLPATIQINIYRIVQELLSNAIRHAQARKIVLQCSQNDNIFLITVEDDGKGFDTAGIAQAKGIGFSNIKNRVEYMKGTLDITSAPNEGTTINIELNVAG